MRRAVPDPASPDGAVRFGVRGRQSATATPAPRHLQGASFAARTTGVALLSFLFVLAAGVSVATPVAITGEQVKGGATLAEVDPVLLERVTERGSAKVLVYLRERADLRAAAHGMSRAARGRLVHQRLKDTADRSQARLKAFLTARSLDHQAFWIDNVIVVRHASRSTLDELRALPEVRALRAEPEIILIEPEAVEWTDTGVAPLDVMANLAHVGAPQVWAQGYTGQGITIGIIDSGVRYTHQAVVGQYRGNLGGGSFDHDYHWWDPYQAPIAPHDPHGHGTHVTGIVAGDDGGANQVGMAPGARWIGCAGFDINTVATTEGLLACGQFMLAPTTLTGTGADPDRRPHAVNNSWSSCSSAYNPWFEGVIEAWIAAGIVPVFGNGNAGNCGYSNPPGLNTVGNPARSGKVLGIGSTGNSNGQYATHSNWGPTDSPNPGSPLYPEHGGFPHLKPNVVAPGVLIRSAYVQGDSDSTYVSATGTSMSSPHVAGLVALMWSAAPCLVGDYAATGTIIQQTAGPVPFASGGLPAPGYDNHPNYATGWGEIDAVTAVAEAQIRCGPHGRLLGTVTSAATGAPIAGVTVDIDNPNGQPVQFRTWTDSEGRYGRVVAANEIPADDYTLNFTRDGGFGSATVEGIHVAPAGEVVVDTELDAGFLVLPEAITVQVPHGSVGSFAVELANQGTVATPVTLDLYRGFQEHFEGSFPPEGWSLAGFGSDCGWTRNDQVAPAEEPIHPGHGGRPNFAGGDGLAAIADADACGPGTQTNASLISPVVDLRGASQVQLDFLASYYHLGDSRFSVAGSHDGGATWNTHVDWNYSVHPLGPGAPTQVDLGDHVGAASLRLRFRYTGLWDWWAQIDRVRIAMDLPWAVFDPLAPDVPPHGTATPQLYVDSAPLPGPGTYRLTLDVHHHTPEQASPIQIPVHVVVTATIFTDGFEGTQP